MLGHHIFRNVNHWNTGKKLLTLCPSMLTCRFTHFAGVCEFSRQDLIHQIVDSCQQLDGYYAVNKPYGLEKRPIPLNVTTKPNLISPGPSLPRGYYFEDFIPMLEARLKCQPLVALHGSEKYVSGGMILTDKVECVARYNHLRKIARAAKKPLDTYILVVLGKPYPDKDEKTVGIKFEALSSNNKQPVITERPSLSQLNRDKAKQAYLSYVTLHHNTKMNASVVQVSTDFRKNHFLRVYMAHLLSPVFGDHMYSSRIKAVMGNWNKVSKAKLSSNSNLLSDYLCQKFSLKRDKYLTVPAHVHLLNSTVPTQGSKSKKFAFKLPEYFLKTLQLLECHHLVEELTGDVPG